MYGAQLIEALRRRLSSVNNGATGVSPIEAHVPSRDLTLQFFGVGGEKMRAAGCDIVVDAKDLSVVGITEILSHLPKIWGRFHKLIAEADKRKPDLAIVIDSPAFNWRVARQMKKRGIPVVYYVCPQFWAWRQGRVRLLRKYVDKALVIFPFEEKFYRERGVDAEFVGHPLARLPRPTVSREAYATENHLVASKPWITLMPGSREKEVRMNLPAMLRTANLLGASYQFVIPVAPAIPATLIREMIRKDTGDVTVQLVSEALPALSHSRAGIIASGTATVEAAMMETPFVMVYRVTSLTYLLGRSTVKVPHFAMVNLIAGTEVVPELIQQDFTPEKLVVEMNKIIPDGEVRQRMIEGLRNVRGMLGKESQSLTDANRPEITSAAEKAASAIFTLISERRSERAPD
jgi:lipid-A-disaccharide synthase